MSNNIITEIQELIQQIKKEYQEGVDFKTNYAGEYEEGKKQYGSVEILSPCLRKFFREKFNFPLDSQNIHHLDYHKRDQLGSNYYYRIKDIGENDTLYWQWNRKSELDEPKKCGFCSKLTFEEDGRMWLWDGKTVGKEFGQDSKIIGYFHPECLKKYFLNKEQSSKNDNARIKEKLLRNLDKISIEQCGHLVNAELVKNYEEIEWYFRKGIFGDDNNPKWKAWWDKVQKVEIEGEEIDLEQLSPEDYWEVLRALISEIKQNPSEWKIEEKKHTHWTEKMIRHQNSGQCHWKSLSNVKDWAEIEALVNGSKIPDKDDKPNNFELENLKKIFEEHDIRKITFENGKLTIEYNKVNSLKKVNNQQFKELEKYCQERNEHEIDQQSLGINPKNTSSNSDQNKNNHQLVVGLTIGASVVMAAGILVYLIKKRKK